MSESMNRRLPCRGLYLRVRRLAAAGAALVMVLLTGCPPGMAPQPPVASALAEREPLRLLVIDDPELAKEIQQQWGARAERGAVVKPISTPEFLAADSRKLGVDVVVYPSGLIGELAERQLIEPLDSQDLNDPSYARRDIFELSRLREVAWGEHVLAFPFGSPQWTLMYRADIFQRLSLEPPATWSEYRAVAERLANAGQPSDLDPTEKKAWSAVVEPLGTGWAGQVLLARAAAYARHRNQYSTLFEYQSLKPLIDGPPFVRALNELLAVVPYFPPDATALAARDARRALLQGRCAMALTWPSRADDLSSPGVTMSLHFAELPGSAEVYDFRGRAWESRGEEQDRRVTLLGISGRLGSVTHESRQRRAAAAMLRWLTGELSQRVCSASKQTTLFRQRHLGAAADWVDQQIEPKAAQQYGEVVKLAQTRSNWLGSVRIPGQDRYLAALDQAVHTTVAGKASSAAALRQAAAAWEQVTESLGREKQQKAYMRSLGLQP